MRIEAKVVEEKDLAFKIAEVKEVSAEEYPKEVTEWADVSGLPGCGTVEEFYEKLEQMKSDDGLMVVKSGIQKEKTVWMEVEGDWKLEDFEGAIFAGC